ncbi:MAG: folate-binding protein [Pseudomonadota bacterium]
METYRRLPRRIIDVSGPEAADLLGGLFTNDLPPEGEARFAALLTPQGKILFDFLMVGVDDGGFLLDVDEAAAAGFEKRLKLYRLRAKVDLKPRDDLAVVWSPDPSAEVPTGAIAAFRDPRLEALGSRAIVEGAEAEDGAAAYTAHRIALGVPEIAAEAGSNGFAPDQRFLMDVNYDALQGVSYSKGCFVGQEVASRMKRKGEVRKRTMRVIFDSHAEIAPGADVKAGSTTLGAMLDGPIDDGAAGLAVIRVDKLDPSAPVDVAGTPARLESPDYLEAD